MNNQASILTDADLDQVIGGADTPLFRNTLDNSTASQAKSASIGEIKSLQVGTPVFRT